MTKKDYIIISNVIRQVFNRVSADYDKTTEAELLTAYNDQFDVIEELAEALAVALKNDNPKFDRARFIDACIKY